jgi:hypothetical protein
LIPTSAKSSHDADGDTRQWLYVDPRAEMVAAKFSSQPLPVCNDMKRWNLALFGTIANII